jgi:hypothetical protein
MCTTHTVKISILSTVFVDWDGTVDLGLRLARTVLQCPCCSLPIASFERTLLQWPNGFAIVIKRAQGGIKVDAIRVY